MINCITVIQQRDARNNGQSLDRHPADLLEVIRTLTADMRAVPEAVLVTIDVSGPPALGGSWDMSTITRALTNLMDNAIRHSPGGTTVHVTATDDDGQIHVAVSDDGPAITTNQLDRVFERSWRADTTGDGTGLGLAIARQIARAHGGDVTVRSPDPTGYSTTFVFSIAR